MTEPPDKLLVLAQYAMRTASKIFDNLGEVSPTWLIETPDEVQIVNTLFTGDMSKDAVAEFIKKELGPKALRLVFVSEAWLRVIKEPHDGLRPSKAPDRIEVIIVSGEDADGQNITIQRRIERVEGQPAKLMPEEIRRNDMMGGRFNNMLKAGSVH